MGVPASHFFVSAPRNLAPVLGRELAELGLSGVRPTPSGVELEGSLEAAYRVCLWSRVANRVLLPVATFTADTPDALYAGTRAVDWSEHLGPEATLAVDAVLVRSALDHSHFAALRVKDGVVDQLRERLGDRPDVDRARPDVRINLYVEGTRAQLAIDLSGESLHRRGYRTEAAQAPLKENLAAALLQMAGWDQAAATGAALLDPMCGSGTFLIEAALMAAHRAPGLIRPRFGFLGWRGHDPALWERLLAEARQSSDLSAIPTIVGYDPDAEAIRVAWANIERAGLVGRVHVERREMAEWAPPKDQTTGVLMVNPPYGKRLGEIDELRPVYRTLGDLLKQRFAGWTAHVLSGDRRLDKAIGLRPRRRAVVFNGPIECRLLTFPLYVGPSDPAEPAAQPEHAEPGQLPAAGSLEEVGLDMYVNRLRKRHRHLSRWAERQGVTCYRLYDADIPEFNLVVDWYAGWLHIQEYAAPKQVDSELARARRDGVLAVTSELLGVPPDRIVFKLRQRQRGKRQYGRLRTLGQRLEVEEGGYRFLVNLTDYLDTGLFLDHRETRRLISELAAGRTFLNLFGYTGTATVYAAGGGARRSTTVDLSRSYLDWARDNLTLNGFREGRHQLVRNDVLKWLTQADERFGLVFVDPPTFSNSKAMRRDFDVQRDHLWLIGQAVRLLEDDGLLIFSTNRRGFRLDVDGLGDRLAVEDITESTTPEDFRRGQPPHHAYRICRA